MSGSETLVAEATKLAVNEVNDMGGVLGQKIITQVRGQLALDALSDPNAFDLILMDVQMPELDGLETTRRIRQREQENGWPRWPIVALSGNAMKEEQDACLAAGMDRCLTKPMNMREVLALAAGTPMRRSAS